MLINVALALGKEHRQSGLGFRHITFITQKGQTNYLQVISNLYLMNGRMYWF